MGVTFQMVLKVGETYLKILDGAVRSNKMSLVGRLTEGKANVG